MRLERWAARLGAIPRPAVFLAVAAAVTVPLLVPLHLPLHVGPEATALFDAIEQLPPRAAVVLAFDFEPSTSAAFHVRDVAIRESDTGAVLVKPSGTASATGTIERTVMDNNGRGLRVEDRSVVHVRDSRAASNVANGFVALAQAGGALSLTLDRVLSVSNGATGVYAGALATVLLSDSTIARNKDGLQAVGGGSIVSDGNNRVFGNTNSNGTPSSMLVPM